MTEYCLLIGAQYSVHQDSSQILSSPDPSLHAELGLLAKLHIHPGYLYSSVPFQKHDNHLNCGHFRE